ncbi:hypothetical protein Ancab_028725 [Ancistrocladus abbreviatus]
MSRTGSEALMAPPPDTGHGRDTGCRSSEDSCEHGSYCECSWWKHEELCLLTDKASKIIPVWVSPSRIYLAWKWRLEALFVTVNYSIETEGRLCQLL